MSSAKCNLAKKHHFVRFRDKTDLHIYIERENLKQTIFSSLFLQTHTKFSSFFMCMNLYCRRNSTESACVSTLIGEAMDGTTCGSGKVCHTVEKQKFPLLGLFSSFLKPYKDL
jgi:hypothetical protein